MARFIIPLVVEMGADLSTDPGALRGRVKGVAFRGNTWDDLKGAISDRVPEGSELSILRMFPFGGLWLPLEDDLPPEPLLFVKIERPTVTQLNYSATPVKTSKRLKFGVFDGKTTRVSLSALIGDGGLLAIETAVNWLWLHLYGASEPLGTFFSSPNHERRYYPYARALFSASAGGTRIEVAGHEDGGTAEQADIQLILGPAEVVPAEVKVRWDYGSVNDPDGIYKNAESLHQLLRHVLKYNEAKESSYTTLTSVICGLEYPFFFRFHIDKVGRGNNGTLALLEHAPWFSAGGRGVAATAALASVRLLDMDTLVRGKAAHDTFADILPSVPPAGFYSLVAFMRTLAGEASGVVLNYTRTDGVEGTAEPSEVLAFGPKSCILSTRRGHTVVKVSAPAYIDIERKEHARIDPGGCPYLRKMVGYGSLSGMHPGLMFLELEGMGVPFKARHVSSVHKLQKCWNEASTAVEFMHQKQVFHRDIKPDNFIVLDSGKASERLVLNDFDCAADWGEADLSEDVGTRMFTSPLRRDCSDYRCCDDWLSLGLSFASLMGLYPSELDDSKKVLVLEGLLANPWAPEDMKTRIGSSLHDKQACCS